MVTHTNRWYQCTCGYLIHNYSDTHFQSSKSMIMNIIPKSWLLIHIIRILFGPLFAVLMKSRNVNLMSRSKGKGHAPRSTSRNGLPLAKMISCPAYWKASFAVHSAASHSKGIKIKFYIATPCTKSNQQTYFTCHNPDKNQIRRCQGIEGAPFVVGFDKGKMAGLGLPDSFIASRTWIHS